jgi:hypothetical protein
MGLERSKDADWAIEYRRAEAGKSRRVAGRREGGSAADIEER